jgi:thioesterase domain-containing protein
LLIKGDPRLEARLLEIVRRRPAGALSDWTDEQILTLLRVTRNNTALATQHQAGRLRCGLEFFCATLSQPDLRQTVDDWRPFLDGPIDVHEMDCHHQHMMQPATLAQVGAVLTSRLARSRSAAAAV